MTNLFGEEYQNIPKKKRKVKAHAVKSWEHAFHRWSTKEYENESTHYAMCGYGAICDFCEDNSYGRPCVRALNEYCKSRMKSINYMNKTVEYFERCFDGRTESKDV